MSELATVDPFKRFSNAFISFAKSFFFLPNLRVLKRVGKDIILSVSMNQNQPGQGSQMTFVSIHYIYANFYKVRSDKTVNV